MVRYGLWLGLGLATGLIQAALIVHTVACLEPTALARVRMRVILRSLLRFAPRVSGHGCRDPGWRRPVRWSVCGSAGWTLASGCPDGLEPRHRVTHVG